ncbi:putative nuclease HARBI1-like protein [Operophtera brumata]|uniref:Putative nuclease HARBI1-like protein n=1 Tax=Operophtera brumata TaxID=104452 RepID=A0A0L7LAM5_OPEBR|nr:putative nuclease HARBI1-like protein [Operophtera brumata]
MDVDEALVVMYYYLRRKREKTAKKRKYWVHPILKERFSLGTFQNLTTELRSDEIKFFTYFRMSITTFIYIRTNGMRGSGERVIGPDIRQM